MANMILEAAKRLRADDHVTVVLWDHDQRAGKRVQMTYAKAKERVRGNSPRNPEEARIIVLPAY